ncbi:MULTISPECIES: NADH-quinone oxidoreductase subunit M [Arcobacter]|jgi:NADH-quinone oxidoreductase subunit M|uniref:NADH-quinone oxidoreductase subunit M n=1 Tax=Arcobacter ellisii TaxID=913109 RepID=A0A347UBS6_9BACT|nr:NADH-quinone oxidoreductase subunit M [Arcobacter ellisii]AXX96304.1 NADH:quinone oxidoreductase I, membrane subunit M [Arcobacter ellisii]MBD3829576.1 NADH-quinone oxidoreductase subunit M [Arcobacter sp.]RXI31855.1 NADH-quinone oxidoreductase subunit M [Arcobacter ellisii]
MENILAMLIFFPAAAAVVGFLIHKDSMRQFGVVVTVVEFVLSLLMWYHFDTNVAGMQFSQNFPLISAYGINYIVGIDGISLFLVVMITFMTMIAVIGLTEKKDIKNLIITMLFLEMTMVGVFVSLDVIMFYVFWELTLIPMFYVIGFWGAEKRFYAAIKFFLYTFTGSLIMLIGILYFGYVYFQTTGVWSFSLMDWNSIVLPFDLQLWLFIAFFMAFAVKVPMFPFHTWLPLAHGQAPTIGSIMLAAVLLKMETYGFIRFSLPLFPDASVYFVPFMAALGLIAIIYTAMVAYAQEDMKQMIAYSSVSHMGVIILGVFALNIEGISGGVFLMIGHGLVSGALFMCVGVLYDRRHTKMIKEFGGLAHNMPVFAVVYAVVLMASIGLPLTIGFIGEFLSLLGFFKFSPVLTFIATLTIVLSAVYMLSMYKRTFYGKLVKPENKTIKDIFGRELVALGSLVVLIIALGIYPKLILEPLNGSVTQVINVMEIKAVNDDTKEKLKALNSIGEVK